MGLTRPWNGRFVVCALWALSGSIATGKSSGQNTNTSPSQGTAPADSSDIQRKTAERDVTYLRRRTVYDYKEQADDVTTNTL